MCSKNISRTEAMEDWILCFCFVLLLKQTAAKRFFFNLNIWYVTCRDTIQLSTQKVKTPKWSKEMDRWLERVMRRKLLPYRFLNRTKSSRHIIRELEQQRRQWQYHETKGLTSKKIALHLRFKILAHVLFYVSHCQTTMSKLWPNSRFSSQVRSSLCRQGGPFAPGWYQWILWRIWSHDSEFFILFLKLECHPYNLVPGYFAISVEVKQIEISSK